MTSSRVIAVFLIGLLAALSGAVPAFAAEMCRTPDGFVFRGGDGKGLGGTGIDSSGDGKGLGGTGIRLSTGKGIGGTGIDKGGLIGVYGRITGFGSICVNGMEIFYGKQTQMPESAMKVGQVVSVVAEQQDGKFVAQQILPSYIASGGVTMIDRNSGIIEISGHSVRVESRDILRAIFVGDHVSVSGFKGPQGDIVASFLEKQDETGRAGVNAPSSGFGANVREVVIQGYVADMADRGALRLHDGTAIFLSNVENVSGGRLVDMKPDDRIIVFGARDEEGRIIAEQIALEHEAVETGLSGFEREQDMENDDVRDKQEDEGQEQEEQEEQEVGEGESDSPGMETPETETDSPETEAPEVESPETEAPEVEAPEVEAPEVEAPEVETPEVEVPETEPPEAP